jgi:two-component system NtrC family sensor kinase
MTEKNLKIRILLTFATMLILAMLLQSIVVLFLGVRASIRQDVACARQILQSVGGGVTFNGESRESEMFSCIYFEPAGEGAAEQSPCRFIDKLLALSQQARVQKKTVIGFAGAGWNTFLFWNEVALIAVPQVNSDGNAIGSITAERSLLPIYSRYKQDVKITLCYLLVNVLLFSSLIFFRISNLFFRPLDSLVQKAETYRPDEQFNLVSDSESPFRKLSTRLNTLFERIERDNSTLRQNVRELEEVNAELKEKNDLVVRSEKLATAGRLSAGLAHEIGNPLAIILGYVELLGRVDLTDAEKKQFSERAQLELDRIQRLIKQLLDFAGPMRSVPETVSVNALINDVIGFVSMEKSFVQCSITTTFFAEGDAIVADRDALRQVLINCLFNAVDATAARNDTERQIVITTSNEKSSTMTPLLVISVQDNGTGIAEEQLEYVFDPFFTTKEVGRGTGLGLFVCHTLMERLAGTITLCNCAPSGVEVKIALPLQRVGHSKQ